MKKILIFRSSQESTWVSCKVISPNLHSAYDALQGEYQVSYFDYTEKAITDGLLTGKDDLLELTKVIKETRPDYLCFVDHLPVPAMIMKKLVNVLDKDLIPPIIIHLYGDFTYYNFRWLEIGEPFTSHPIKFIVASDAQKKLFSSFLNETSEDYVCKFPFPVRNNDFYFDEDERVSFRRQMGVKDDEKIILYSGRISLQKNVDVLISNFAKWIEKSAAPLKLWIAGAFDDMGAPFLGVIHHEGFMYMKIQKLMKTLPEEARKRIHFFGNQKKDVLRQIINSSDLFASLSIYHDEDYGMAPAEALACGLPSVLTDWGGYSSFASPEWNCKIVPVKITELGHSIYTGKLEEMVLNMLSEPHSVEERRARSERFKSQFGSETAPARLRKVLSSPMKPFPGFNWQLYHLSHILFSPEPGKQWNTRFSPSDKTFYNEVYKHYISTKVEEL